MDEERFGRERIDANEELRLARETMRRTARRLDALAPIVVGLLALGWLASGVYTVQPGEVAVIRTFGLFTGTASPGLNYRWPSPIQQHDIVNLQIVRRLEVGFRTQEGRAQRVASEALMLTGDENIIDAQIIVQYRVRDPVPFLFKLRNPDDVVRASTEVALRGVAGKMRIDDMLTTRRGEAEQQASDELQRLMDLYESGILVTAVKLQTVDVPDEVKDAFNDVVRAFQDRDRLKNEAEAYVADIIPKARGQAQQTIRAAEAYREQRILQADGDANRFLALLAEYSKAKAVTRERLRLETVERVLAEVDKIVIDGGAGNNVLPFLPLRDATVQRAPAPTQPQAQPQVRPAPVPTPGATSPGGQTQTQPARQPTPRPKQ